MRSAFLPALHASDRLPVVLLGGYLGSGKTTILNALLKAPELADTAVAINEFGAVPIDQHLVEGTGPDDTIVMANGCLCCNLSGDVESAVLRLFARREAGALPRFRRLIIEPSGLADPEPLVQALLRNPILSATFRLEAVVVAVDALFGAEQLDEHREAAAQVALADRLLVTKTDLATPAAIAALHNELRRRNPVAPMMDCRHGTVAPDAVLPAAFLTGDDNAASVAEWLATVPVAARQTSPAVEDHHHHSSISATSLTAEQPLDWTRFDAWLKRVRLAPKPRLLRVKGLIAVEGEAGPVVVQGVRHVLHPPIALTDWPSDDHRSRLVLIAEGRLGAEVATGWNDLQHTEAHAHAGH